MRVGLGACWFNSVVTINEQTRGVAIMAPVVVMTCDVRLEPKRNGRTGFVGSLIWLKSPAMSQQEREKNHHTVGQEFAE